MQAYELSKPMVLAFARPAGVVSTLVALSLLTAQTCAQRAEQPHRMEIISQPAAHHVDRAH